MAMDTKRPVNRREVEAWAKARDIGLGDIDRLGREGGLLRIELPVQDVERAKCPFPRKERRQWTRTATITATGLCDDRTDLRRYSHDPGSRQAAYRLHQGQPAAYD